MFGKRFDLFRLGGIPIRLDLSWFFIALLIAWSLATAVFPNALPGQATRLYWAMGVAGALGLFASIIVHELAHTFVARRTGTHIGGITLFIFGGVAEMADEPPSARAEFLMAGAGPLASLVIALVCGGVAFIARDALPTSLLSIVEYLATINLLLALFNLVPAFPLDGGRILRAGIWHWRRDLRAATRIASAIGSAFAFILVALGAFRVLAGDFITGMWWALIGLFLRSATATAYRRVLLRDALAGEAVLRFMNTNPVWVPADASLSELVDDYVYRHHHTFYPVVENGRLSGCITTRQVKDVPRAEWDTRTVGAAAMRCSPDITVQSDTDAVDALARMQRSGTTRLLVVEGERLLGILTLKDLLEFFALKAELESGTR